MSIPTSPSSEPKRYLGYARVSSRKQGESGIGIEAQRQCIEAFVSKAGGKLVRTYVEVESGRKTDNRPELQKALAEARRTGATILVGKLDRLSREVHFIAATLKTGIPFEACDYPGVGPFVWHILGAVAEHEAKLASERSKAACAVLKSKGVKLGRSDNFTDAGRKLGAVKAGSVNRQKASEAYSDIAPTMKAMRDQGMTLGAIADHLNQEGHLTRRGKAWNKVQVARVIERCGA